ncbi:glyoxalase-like domain protein [Nodosilinea sp. AN01ver1]|uniref:glyoxalase-like domain protein n=1 Tax=Nodosilinea sp. AN01ver1 TaxID=3423362 RepID=UPI003D31E1BC
MLFNLSLTYPTPVALLGLPLDSIMSTQGVMVMLLVAYAGAMWMFLKSAPKVYTVMVSDLEIARRFYEGMLNLPAAEVPLHYYYNYEQTLGTAGLDPMYLGGATSLANQGALSSPEGLWYQLRKNTQLHVISGASLGHRNQQRHVCFDHNCLEYILMRVQLGGVQHKIRNEKPLNFLVRDYDNQVIELAEIDD